jgi:pimeloyl-ACP methyl ester carboxylesterase
MSNIIPATTVKTVSVDGIDVFYREAGDQKAPVILLLHGFPTSSFQYRNLITRLALQYRVIVSFLEPQNPQ